MTILNLGAERYPAVSCYLRGRREILLPQGSRNSRLLARFCQPPKPGSHPGPGLEVGITGIGFRRRRVAFWKVGQQGRGGAEQQLSSPLSPLDDTFHQNLFLAGIRRFPATFNISEGTA